MKEVGICAHCGVEAKVEKNSAKVYACELCLLLCFKCKGRLTVSYVEADNYDVLGTYQSTEESVEISCSNCGELLSYEVRNLYRKSKATG